MMTSQRGYGLALLASILFCATVNSEAAAQPAQSVSKIRAIDIRALNVVTWQRFPQHRWDAASPSVLPSNGPLQPEVRLVRRAHHAVQITLGPLWQGSMHHAGWISSQEPVLPGGRGGAFDVCGGNGWVRPLRFDGVHPRADGAIDYLRGFAWFNGYRCTVHSVARRTAVALPILEDSLFAFVSRCPKCALDEREELHVIRSSIHRDVAVGQSPDSRVSADKFVYEHQHTSIAAGTSGRMTFGIEHAPGKFFPAPRVQAVIEVQRAAKEPRPTVLLYTRVVSAS